MVTGGFGQTKPNSVNKRIVREKSSVNGFKNKLKKLV